jgi:GPH family glycoside/pentoside/hexuronide:cation symporter
LYWFSLNLLLMLVPRRVEEVLHLRRDAVTWVMLPFIGVNLVGFFVVNWLGKRIGKFRGFLVVLELSALMFPLLAVSLWLMFAPPLTVMQVLLAVSGLPVAGFAVLPFALLADVIDVDAKSSGARREAIYFGVQAIFQKSIIGLSIVAFATSHALFGARSLPWIAGAAGGICAMGLVIFCFYPLRKQF